MVAGAPDTAGTGVEALAQQGSRRSSRIQNNVVAMSTTSTATVAPRVTKRGRSASLAGVDSRPSNATAVQRVKVENERAVKSMRVGSLSRISEVRVKHEVEDVDDDDDSDDVEDSSSSEEEEKGDEYSNSKKRATKSSVGTARKRTVKVETSTSSTTFTSAASATAITKKSKFATKEPKGWQETLDKIREYRQRTPAPVDTMGCERLAEVGDHIPPQVSRFQTLMALVLSSQTKDTVTSVAVRRLQKELVGGLTIEGVLAVESEQLNKIIGAVGFHNKKTIFMKQVAEICRTKYNGDIPSTPEELIALPGVGPKMAYLTLQCAWNKNLGIGVDVHVHRIANRLGWIKTEKDGPEGTREALQSWLPKEHWREINYLLVGFGQTLCLPRGPICAACPVNDRCPTSSVKKRKGVKKEETQDMVKEEVVEPGKVAIHVIKMEHEGSEAEIVKQEPVDTSPYFSSDPTSTASVTSDVLLDAATKEGVDIEDIVP